MLYIGDGKGRGNTAGVSCDNQLMTLSTVETIEHYMNVIKGSAFSTVITETPSISGACIYYMKNTDDHDVIIEEIEVFTDDDQILEIYLSDIGTPVNGNTLNPVNNNSGSANSAVGVFQSGSNITGLSGGNKVSRLKIKGNEQSRVWNFPCDLVLSKNRSFSIYCASPNVETNINVFFFYDHDGKCS